MATMRPRGFRLFVGVAIALAGVWGVGCRESPPPPASQPATQPAAPATAEAPAEPARPVTNWLDVVLREHPDFPTSRPLSFPVDWPEAARLVIRSPVYVCPRGDLWITHADAPPTAAVLRSAVREQAHVVRERVRYAHWGVTEAGVGYVALVCDVEEGLELVSAVGRKALRGGRGYRWDRAFSWNGRIVVPTADGVSVIDPDAASEQFQTLLDEDGTPPERVARVLLDRRGVIAWLPPGGGAPAGGVARYVDGAWQRLGPDQGWPPGVVELFPLLDGTVIVLAQGDDGGNRLTSLVLDAVEQAPVDEAGVEKLVTQLSADEQPQRDAAMAELSRYGPRAWPILERLRPLQPAEAQMRLDELLAAKQAPSLGVLRPAADDLRVVTRLRDGGVVLYSDAGVEIPRGGSEPRVVAPAWISVRPGRAASLLPAALTADASPDRVRVSAWGDEWVVADDVVGPKRFLGNHLRPLLKPHERSFARWAGIDSRGRWLFADDAASATLVVDRFLPDPTPRLPVWTIRVEEGDVGWSEKDWPVTRRGGAWALLEDRWEALPDDAPVFTEPAPPPPTATRPADDGAILVEPDGTRWYDGVVALRRVSPGDQEMRWTLPPEVLGAADGYARPALIRAEGRLFLFNAPGRVVRLREASPGSGDGALSVEAVFTRKIPNVDRPTRVWLDPAGRMVIATEGNTLSILFPAGRIPGEIRKMMPAGEEEQADQDGGG